MSGNGGRRLRLLKSDSRLRGPRPAGSPGARRPAQAPVDRDGRARFTFVAGIEGALAAARAVADHKDVPIAGGANVAQRFLRAGLIDEPQIHVVPTLPGEGTRLFDRLSGRQVSLDPTRVVASPGVTHLRFRADT